MEPTMTGTPSKPDFLTMDQLVEFLQISKPTLYRWMKKAGFPPGKRVGPRFLRWERTVVEEWMRSAASH